MNQLQRRYRAWLDRRMPTSAQESADRAALLAAVDSAPSRRARPIFWVVTATAVGAGLGALIVLWDSPPTSKPAAPPHWDVIVSLHEVGAPPERDVRIQIGVRKED